MTDVALKEYLERLIAEHDRRYEQRFAASEQAVQKAERGIASRLDSMNEFREALKDQSSRMATRDELKKIEADVNELRRARANLDGKVLVISAVISAGVGLLVSVIARMLLP